MANGMRSSEREKSKKKNKKKNRKAGRRCDGGETQLLKKKKNGTYGAVYTKLIHPDPSEGNEATDGVYRRPPEK